MAVLWAWNESRGMRANDAWVLRELASFVNSKTGLCCPSIQSLMDGTRLGRTAVEQAIRDLEKAGQLVRKARKVGNALTSNTYALPRYKLVLLMARAAHPHGAITPDHILEAIEAQEGIPITDDVGLSDAPAGNAKVVNLFTTPS